MRMFLVENPANCRSFYPLPAFTSLVDKELVKQLAHFITEAAINSARIVVPQLSVFARA